MERRSFLGGALLASAQGASGPTAHQAVGASSSGKVLRPEVYELRQYRVRIGHQPGRLREYLQSAALPALKRLGHGPIGVFEPTVGELPALVVLIPHPNLESVASLSARLDADAEHRKAGAAFLEPPAGDPPFLSLESEVLVAFDNLPKLERPAEAAAPAPRVFELRTYLSPSESAHRRKMDMFLRLGEMEIFRRTGLRPVFFGRAVAGKRLPSFTYLLVFADEAARAAAWAAFRSDAEWDKLRNTPGYTDAEIMAGITTVLLRPAPFSEI
jgi:hypothetical protein